MTTNPTPEHKEQARAILRACEERTGMDLASDSLPNDLADRIASALSSRDTEIREVLEGLSTLIHYTHGQPERCWCNNQNSNWTHTQECLAACELYATLHPSEKKF